MQTFLPVASLNSTIFLDDKRLGKQRVETLQILRALNGETKGWINHPATKMWADYEQALAVYGWYCCENWLNRGFKDTCQAKIEEYISEFDDSLPTEIQLPPWFGNEKFHASHRSNLLRKNPEHYRQFWPDEPDDLEYFWPTKEKTQ